MAVAVQTTSSGTWSSSGSVTITKPTSLTVGDLLLAIIASSHDGGGTVTVPSTPAGWTAGTPLYSSQKLKIKTFYKVADSGDVAASNFTFSGPTAGDWINGSLMRISGQASSPIDSFVSAYDATDDTSFTSGTISLNTRIDNALVVMVWVGRNTTGDPTVSGYTVSGTNPTWTERTDAFVNDDLSHVLSVATATISTARTLTSASATPSISMADAYLLMFNMPASTPASVNADVLSITGSMQEPTPQGKATISVDALSITATAQDADGEIMTPEWVNTDASADPTWINTDKS